MAPNPNVNPEFMVENGALKTPLKVKQLGTPAGFPLDYLRWEDSA